MDEVIVFDKSLQQRLQEYEDVFSGIEKLDVNIIQREWSYFLEFTIDHSGWQAIWKIDRRTCEHLDIAFPSIVLVYVISVDFSELTALVKILAVQDEDIHLPDKHHVPLLYLWPTKNQEKSIVLNLEPTANSLDMLRFFYNSLLMPWDSEEDGDWKSKHLENRIRLHYDMKLGIIPKSTADHIHALITEAKRLQVKEEMLEDEMYDEEDESTSSINMDDQRLQSLSEIHVRMMEIKTEFEILENPLLRSAVIKKQKETSCIGDDLEQQKIWVIFDQGKAKDLMSFLVNIEQQFPNETLHLSSLLCHTLESANANDIFILKDETSHIITSTGALTQGGVLKGISANKKSSLTTKCDDLMLDFNCDQVVLENLIIDATKPQCAIIVRRGTVTLKNCSLIGDGKSSTHQGVIVLAEAHLEIIDSEISNFYTAIVGNSGSRVTIINSEIFSCNYGIKVFGNCTLNAIKATIRNCKKYGICVEVDQDFGGPKVGDFDALSIIPTVKIECMKGFDNAKGDAVINHKAKLHPVEDFFENPDLDPTVIIASDDDENMEEQNNTAVECSSAE